MFTSGFLGGVFLTKETPVQTAHLGWMENWFCLQNYLKELKIEFIRIEQNERS